MLGSSSYSMPCRRKGTLQHQVYTQAPRCRKGQNWLTAPTLAIVEPEVEDVRLVSLGGLLIGVAGGEQSMGRSLTLWLPLAAI